MKKICLIRPSRVGRNDSLSLGVTIPPIGLAYLVSSLRKEGFNVFPIDAVGEKIDQCYQLSAEDNVYIQGMSPDEIIKLIPKDTFLIGISCMYSCEWFFYHTLILEIKKAFPLIPIIVGGEHVTAEAENLLKICPEVSVCVRGEGEQTLIELTKAYFHGFSFHSIDGITYHENGVIIKNPPRKRIANLDDIPPPDWSDFPIEAYFRAGYGVASIKRKSIPILASRGCPYQCTFCSCPQMWGNSLYLRTPRLVVDEIKEYIQKYNVEHIDFVDLVGFCNREWVKELLQLMIDEKLGVTWIHGAGTRSEILDEEILLLLKKSNVLRVFYAPESGSQETLKKIQKKVNLPKMLQSMKIAHRLDISMRAPVIYGFPGQTLKEAFENLFFSLKLSYIGVDDVVGHTFSASPGSELYYQLVKSGDIDIDSLIKNNEYSSFLRNEVPTRFKNFKSWSKEIPSSLIAWFQYGGMSLSYSVSFLFHPKKILQTFRRVFIEKKPLTLFDLLLFKFFFNK